MIIEEHCADESCLKLNSCTKVLVIWCGLYGPTLRAGSHRFPHPGPPLCGRGHGGHAIGFPHPRPPVTAKTFCSGHGSTLARPPGSRPRSVSCTVTVQRSRQVSVVTYPCSHPAVTSPRYLTSPGHGPLFPCHVPRSRSLFPQPVHPLGSRSQCSDGGSAAHGSLHGAKLEARSWSGVACRHAAALYSKRCAGSISRAGFIAGWSCGGE